MLPNDAIVSTFVLPFQQILPLRPFNKYYIPNDACGPPTNTSLCTVYRSRLRRHDEINRNLPQSKESGAVAFNENYHFNKYYIPNDACGPPTNTTNCTVYRGRLWRRDEINRNLPQPKKKRQVKTAKTIKTDIFAPSKFAPT